MKNKIIVAIIFIFISSLIADDELQQEWVRQYAGPDSVEYYSYIAIDTFDNIYVVVYSYAVDSTKGDIELLKYNTEGDLKWVRRYSGPGGVRDKPFSIATDNKGHVYILGSSDDTVATKTDFITLKYDSSGNKLWHARYNRADDTWADPRRIAVDNERNVIFIGHNSNDFVTVKYDSMGNELWADIYDGGNNTGDYAYDMCIDEMNYIYVVGSSELNNLSDIVIIKYDPNGNICWKTNFSDDASGHNIARAIKVDKKYNVYVTGYSIYEQTYEDFMTIKLDSLGEIVFSQRYNGPPSFYDKAQSVLFDKNGNIYTGGLSDGINTYADFTIVKYDSVGNELWTVRYDALGSTDEDGGTMVMDNDGNVFISGYTNDYNGTVDFLTVAYSQDGYLLGHAAYHDNLGAKNFTERKQSMALDSKSNVYITGFSQYGPYGEDGLLVTLVKYSGIITGIDDNPIHIPHQPSLHQNYPNPFNTITKIAYDISVPSHVELTIYNILGQRIAPLINRNLNPGQYELAFDASVLPSGVYFYQLKTAPLSKLVANFIETKKFILIK